MARFYSKLLAMILAMALIQCFVFGGARDSEVWFGLRCEYAYVMKDWDMLDELMVECRQKQLIEWQARLGRVQPVERTS